MTVARPSLWIERYRQALRPGVIKERAERKGFAIHELAGAEVGVACSLLERGLKAVCLVTLQMESIIRAEIERALAHAILVYSEPHAALKAGYGTAEFTDVYMPSFITGLAGVGKSHLRACIGRVLGGRRQIRIDDAHPEVPLIDYVDCVIGLQRSVHAVLRPLASREVAEGRIRAINFDLLTDCANWQRACGVCLLGVDEMQFMAASASATTLVTQTMLALAQIRVPWFVIGNYSLAWKLLSRPSEATQRLLGRPVVLLPDPPASDDWAALLGEYEIVLAEAVDFRLLEFRLELWNLSAGMKRELAQLLVDAYRIARQSGATRARWEHVLQAYNSLEFTAARRDINLLITHAGQGGALQQDLACPFQGPGIAKGSSAFSRSLQDARDRQVANAVIRAAASGAEGAVLDHLAAPTNREERNPAKTEKLSRQPRRSLKRMIDAGLDMRSKVGRDPKR